MNHSPNHLLTQPRNGNGQKISQRGLLSIALLIVSIGALGVALLGGLRLVMDIFDVGLENSFNIIGVKAIVISLAYGVGWFTALVASRVYGNLILPMLIYWIIWGCLAGICVLYVLILQRLFSQAYDMPHYWAYLMIIASALGALVGLHLIIEDHDLRPLSIPLLIISLFQLALIVYRYVFTVNAQSGFLWKDLLFFLGMSAFSIFMLAHLGILEPLRARLTDYFDRNSKSIRLQD